MPNLTWARCAICILAAAPAARGAEPDSSRQEHVHARSAEVMPFEMAATTHVFTQTAHGGIQRVMTKQADDAQQAGLIRAHLRELAGRFTRRDFAGPAHVHGDQMPGLAVLRAARPEELRIAYRDVAGGGELEYHSNRQAIVEAVHQWFDAQLADHGADAMPGDDHAAHHPH